jgi:hypothetical protein
VLLLPYTGLIQAALIGLPAMFSLLALLLLPAADDTGIVSSDVEAGRGRKHYTDGRCVVAVSVIVCMQCRKGSVHVTV